MILKTRTIIKIAIDIIATFEVSLFLRNIFKLNNGIDGTFLVVPVILLLNFIIKDTKEVFDEIGEDVK